MADPAVTARCAGHLVLFGAVLLLALYGRLAHRDVALVGLGPSSESVQRHPAWLRAGAGTGRGYLPAGAVFSTHRVLREVPPAPDLRWSGSADPSAYTVSAGDTLQSVAEQFGLQPHTIVWANDDLATDPGALHAGQELLILPVDGVYHVAVPGETIGGIAAKYGVEPELIWAFPGNNLEAGVEPPAGQGLVIPGAQARYADYSAGVGSLPFLPSADLPEGATGGTGALIWPLSGVLSQGYWAGHPAIDIAAPGGTPVLAADAGVVGLVEPYHPQYGRFVVLNHGGGLQTLYAHLESTCVEAGTAVQQGQVIGGCGSTGNSTGTHLHLEVYQSGQRQNPLFCLPSR